MFALTFACEPFDALSLRELYELMALRQRVFVVEQHCCYLDADGKDLHAYHLLGRNDAGRLLACVRLLPPGISYPDHASVGRVIIAAEARNQGLGRPLMEEVLRRCQDLYGASGIKISAQSHLRRYYEGLGFVTQGEHYYEDGIPHVAMVWE